MRRSNPQLVILVHKRQAFGKDYILSRLAQDYWSPSGLDVAVHWGLEGAPRGDLAILHVDLTAVPEDYRKLAQRYPRHTNASTPSIAKTSVSTSLLDPSSAYEGSVIVKTDANYMGRRELEVYRAEVKASINPIKHLLYRFRRDILWRRNQTDSGEYKVYASKSAVPPWIWQDKRFVVEAFRPNHDGQYYFIYRWFFLGKAEFCYRCFSRDPIIRRDGDEDLQREIAPVPEDLRAWRRKLGLDFGKVDFLVHEGKALPIDVAHTPTLSDATAVEIRDEICHALAPGLASLLVDDGAPTSQATAFDNAPV